MLFFNFLAGTAYGSLEFPKLTFSSGVNLRAGINTITLLSIAVGLPVGSLSLSHTLMLAYIHTKMMFYENVHGEFESDYILPVI